MELKYFLYKHLIFSDIMLLCICIIMYAFAALIKARYILRVNALFLYCHLPAYI